jgi:hypothetical protein
VARANAFPGGVGERGSAGGRGAVLLGVRGGPDALVVVPAEERVRWRRISTEGEADLLDLVDLS